MSFSNWYFVRFIGLTSRICNSYACYDCSVNQKCFFLCSSSVSTIETFVVRFWTQRRGWARPTQGANTSRSGITSSSRASSGNDWAEWLLRLSTPISTTRPSTESQTTSSRDSTKGSSPDFWVCMRQIFLLFCRFFLLLLHTNPQICLYKCQI